MNAERAPTTLHGPRLLAARIIWIAIAALTLALFIALIPINWRTVINDWNVQQAMPAARLFVAPSTFARYVLVLRYISLFVFLTTAALIFWRKSNDWMALLVSVTLATLPLAFSLGGYTESWAYYRQPWRDVFVHAREALTFFVAMPGLLAFFFLFPDGRVVPRWLGWVGLILSAGMLLFALLLPFDVDSEAEWVWISFYLTLLAAMLAAVCGQIYRYQRIAGPAERQQIRLVVMSLAVFAFSFLFQIVLEHFTSRLGYRGRAFAALIGLHWLLFILTLIPVSIAISILRYRLWDVDLIVNRTLVYGALTATIVALYIVVVGVLGAWFQTAGNVLLSVLATGLIAILFNPLRQRLQGAVNRLMYGERDDPATVLSRLGQRLESALAPEAVLPTIVETVAQALKAPYAAIEVNSDQSSVIRDQSSMVSVEWKANISSAITDRGSLITIPLAYQSETIGQLIVAPRAPGEAFSPADQRLLDTLARQAAPAVHAYRLTADLQRSRERIVTAREEERRRIRRDLHDGLGPALASQTLKLDAALDLLAVDPAAAQKLLTEIKAQTQTTVADIRRLVYELRPPALDELGLAGALRAHIQNHAALANGLSLTFDAPPDLPSLSAAVEVAAYRIVSEATTNVARHAVAHRCCVRLSLTDDHALQLEIEDDGLGLPAGQVRTGVGLTSMRERAAELGGTCVIENLPAGGARVYARLPIG